MGLENFYNLIPNFYLFFQVTIDVFKLFKKESIQKTNTAQIISVLIIFLYYAFFINGGISLIVSYLTEKINYLRSTILSMIILFCGYQGTKYMVPRTISSKILKNKSLFIFLHYFYYSSGATIALVLVFIIAYAIYK